MSERSTGLFIAGHVDPQEVVTTLLRAPTVRAGDLQGEETPRVGHGVHAGAPFTHVGLRLFELGGLLHIDRTELPGADEVETYLGMALSAAHGKALFLHYDDEQGVGGHALYVDGLLVSRRAVDGRWDEPIVRDLDGERVMEDVDPSHWVWPHVADAVAEGAQALFGEGVRSDDDIAELIQAAAATPVKVPLGAAPRTEPAAEAPSPGRTRKRDRLLGLVKGLMGRG
ncbi:MAG: hypothetical protein H6740_01690 [Alphaproteobacteria bacterium]|nr:hypothetical protein [Alphaproteobacteria bacterium]